YDVNDYLIIAALRAKLYEEALNRVKVLLGSINSEAFILPKTSNKNFSVNAAKIALLGLKKILDANKIQFFLVSGTLLGCIRDKKLLKHDKDIDIGVWSETNLSVLSTKIACSGLFDIAPMRSPYTLR
ncbi:LicD family protein, partial [Escherichia coli]